MLCTFDEVFFNVVDNLTVKTVALGKILCVLRSTNDNCRARKKDILLEQRAINS